MILFDRKTHLRVFTDRSSIDIEGLNVSFVVNAHRRRTPNDGEFVIYNLGGDKRSLIEQEAKYLEFYAGYASSPLGRIFTGFVDRSSSLLKGPTWMTTMKAVDSGESKQYTLSSVSETFAAGTPVVSLFKKFAEILNMPMVSDYAQTEKLLASETYTGPLRNALDEVSRDYGYSWSIQHGTLEIIKQGDPPIKDSAAINLSVDNILDVPEVTNRGARIKTLVLPNLIPSRIITVPPNIQSSVGRKTKKAYKEQGLGGTYIADSIKYTGSRDGKSYYADIDAWRQQ